MKLVVLSSNLVKATLILTLTLSATSNKDAESIESKSIDSGGDDAPSLEDRIADDTPWLDLTGNLRKTMVYHMGLLDTRKSSVCSPLSALLPLGKLAMGSSSRRYSELKAAIGYSRSKLQRKFKSLMSHLQHLSGKVQLTIASRLYISDKETIRTRFHSRVANVFRSSCEKVNMNNGRQVASSINNWVSVQTKGLIKNIIKPGEITSQTSLIIINAIYFLGRWKHKFTSLGPNVFYAPSKQRTVTMMSAVNDYKYVKSSSLRAQIVEIPYSGRDVSLLIVLPLEERGLASVLRQLVENPGALNSALGQMRETTLDLSIPKFKVNTNLDLNSLYFKIGLKEILRSDNKVLTKIIRDKNVFVSKSVHAAVIDVNEHGTEAGAVSALLLHKSVGNTGRMVLKADHPFLYFVVANHEQLFGGTFVVNHLQAVSGNYHTKFRAHFPFLFYVVANGEQLFGGIFTGE